MRIIFNRRKQKGEIILIILLVMAVGLTIGLSVAGRSLTDVRLSNQIEESGRAFSAAEAGIEEALKAGITSTTATYQGSTTNATYKVALSSLGGTASQFSFPNTILEGDTQTIWLVPNLDTGPDLSAGNQYAANTITICWSKISETATIPALEISLFYQAVDGSDKVTRIAYDSEVSRSGNGFDNTVTTPGTCTDQSSTYNYQVNLDFTTMPDPSPVSGNILIALRLRPVYADAKIAVIPETGITLPEQGKNISSTGQTDSGVTRKWNVVQTYAASQDIFDYAIWSKSAITK